MDKMTKETANKIYDVLVSIGGADEMMRDAFVGYHLDEQQYHEWRFAGKLGFGGKYRSEYNKVDCYREDETPDRLRLINEINGALAGFKN